MSISRASGCFVIVGNSVLLAERAPNCYITGKPLPFPYYWSIFVGAIELNENPIVCAQRELFEETAIKVDLHELEYVYAIQNETCELQIYGVTLEKLPNVTINAEHLQYGWFDINSLNNFPHKIDQTIVDAILFYKKNRYKLP